jgi:hypothetical protein
MTGTNGLRVERRDGDWVLAGPPGLAGDLRWCNDYLGYLADRQYAAGTQRSYAFDLLALCRWLEAEEIGIEQVDTAALLRLLASCQGLAAATINRRMAAVSGLFAFRAMRDPDAGNPIPTGPAARRLSPEQRGGLLGHLAHPRPRSRLRARAPRRLPRGLEPGEVTRFLASLRTWRDRAIAGLMVFSGLRSAEVLALQVTDVEPQPHRGREIAGPLRDRHIGGRPGQHRALRVAQDGGEPVSHPAPGARVADRGQRVEQAVRDTVDGLRPDVDVAGQGRDERGYGHGRGTCLDDQGCVRTSMITNAVSRPPPLHHHRRVTARHAAISDYAGALGGRRGTGICSNRLRLESKL